MGPDSAKVPYSLFHTVPCTDTGFLANSGANIGVYWLRAHALGAERDIEVTISNKTFEQNGAKITFHHTIRVYND